MKRMIPTILALALCASMAGCGEGGSPATSSTVSAEALALAAGMPAASWQSFPDWRGYTVTDRYWTKDYGVPDYEREEVETLAELGFNFIRAPLHLESIFPDGDPGSIDTDFLGRMDRLLEYCAAEGVHVCFDLHDMPGFRTNDDSAPNTLFTDEAAQELFVEFWRFLADWYRDVPSSLLSFNLLNEPHPADGEELTDEAYSALMRRAIDAIRESSTDRLIFVDMLDIPMGTPVQGLADAQVVQSAHLYFPPDGTQSWPCYFINGFIHRDKGTLSIWGNFPAGTELSFVFDSVHLNSRLSVIAGGRSAASLSLGGDAVGENGCVEIGEAGTEGEWRRYDGAALAVTLSEDCSAIELRQEGGWWYQLRSFTVKKDAYAAQFTADAGLVPDEDVPTLTLDGDGIASAEKGETLAGLPARLEEQCRSYQAFTQETGTRVMAQEFGFNNTLPHRVVLDAAGDLFSLLDDCGIPWCSWNGDLGPLIDARDNAAHLQSLLHTDVAYEELSQNWLLDRELMEVFRRHMA